MRKRATLKSEYILKEMKFLRFWLQICDLVTYHQFQCVITLILPKKNWRLDSTAPLSADSCEILFSITSHKPLCCKIIYQRFGDKM